MVIKGGARAEADKLAAHLLRVDTNERVDVRELAGVISLDLTAALLEMEAVATAARSRRPFYHASINTALGELLTEAQKARTIDRLEEELELTGQPRIVVEHVKEGREHLHVAWSRIDGETLKAIPDSHNYRRHEIVARELEREFSHARVQGAHHERDGVERPGRRPSQAETMQAGRSGISPEQAKEQLRGLWRSADSGQAFAAALDNAGWILAQGDRRGFVALDPTGEVRSINKDITGLSAAKVRERLADLNVDRLPSVDKASSRQRERQPAPALGVHQAAPEQIPENSQHEIRAVDIQPEPAPVHQAERSRDAAAEDRVAAILRKLDERFYSVPPLPVREAAPQPVREPEAERVREPMRISEPVAQPAPEPVRPSLFQMLTMGMRAWWQGLQAAPQPERAADRQHDAGGDRQAAHVTMPVRVPAPTPAPEPVRQQQQLARQPEAEPAQQPEPQRPAERMRRSLADYWIDEARAELAAERARETPEQREKREQLEAERSRGRGDGGRERSRYHHALLWELLHPFQHGPNTRHRQRQP